MAGGIKGITVKIGGDTTELGRSLKNATTTAKSLQTELKGVNTLLKMDPGNVTLLIGTDDDRVDRALEIIRKHCAQRMEPMPAVMNVSAPALVHYQTEVPVGGATVFVSPVERFEKM